MLPPWQAVMMLCYAGIRKRNLSWIFMDRLTYIWPELTAPLQMDPQLCIFLVPEPLAPTWETQNTGIPYKSSSGVPFGLYKCSVLVYFWEYLVYHKSKTKAVDVLSLIFNHFIFVLARCHNLWGRFSSFNHRNLFFLKYVDQRREYQTLDRNEMMHIIPNSFLSNHPPPRS